MRKALLDENTTERLTELLPGHDMRHARQMGWAGLKNGPLLAVAGDAGFDALITVDKNIYHQQNLEGKPALIVLDIHPTSPANQIACLNEIEQHLGDLKMGEVYVVKGPHAKRERHRR